METKSAIAIQNGKKITAILCETGDYVELGPCLQQHWTEDRVENLIQQGSQYKITETSNVPSKEPLPASTFYTFDSFMRYFENMFCEDYYIISEGVWYYTGAGHRTVTNLDIKLQALSRTWTPEEIACMIHTRLP